MKPLNVFVHTPRTGGTTFMNLLKNNNLVYKSVTEETDWRSSFDKCDWLVGHITPTWITIGRRGKLVSPRFFTLIREPIERTMSFYRLRKCQVPIEKFVSTSQTKFYKPHIRNATVRTLVCDKRSDIPDNSNLCKAKEFLHMWNFGFTSDYDVSLAKWNDRYDGLFNTIEYDIQNAGGARSFYDNFSQRDIDMIVDANQLDLELYEYANKLWEKNAKI